MTRQALLARDGARRRPRSVDEIWAKRAPDLPIKSPGELVTLASIVEKETGKADERPRVAGVFVNRLRKHMKLESDPTIVYGLVFGKGTLGHPISKAELEQPTPYNTYIIAGLPPGPICNPGQGGARGGRQSDRDQGALFRRRRHGRPRLRRDARPAPQERRPLAPDREGRQGPARARRGADAEPDRRRRPSTARSIAVDPGDLGAVALGARRPTAGRSATRLAKLAEGRRLSASLLAPTAPCRRQAAGRQPRGAGRGRHRRQRRAADRRPFPTIRRADAAPPSGRPAVPLSAAALADQKARIARYGDARDRRAARRRARRARRRARRGRAPSTLPKARRSIRCSTRPTISTTRTQCPRSTIDRARPRHLAGALRRADVLRVARDSAEMRARRAGRVDERAECATPAAPSRRRRSTARSRRRSRH